jgi:hypothetical protein
MDFQVRSFIQALLGDALSYFREPVSLHGTEHDRIHTWGNKFASIGKELDRAGLSGSLETCDVCGVAEEDAKRILLAACKGWSCYFYCAS